MGLGQYTTCQVSGFFFQLGLANMFYYVSLNLYYLLTIRFGVRDEVIQKRVEPFMHIVSIGFPLVTATMAAARGLFKPSKIGNWCWFAACESGIALEDCESQKFGWSAMAMPTTLFLIFLSFSNATIFLHVRRTVRASNNIRSRSSLSGSLSQETQDKRIQLVATQCFLYVAAFLLTYGCMYVHVGTVTAKPNTTERQMYWVLLAEQIFTPLNGFYNLCIYLRPDYIRCREKHATQSRWWAVRRTLFGEAVKVPVKAAEKVTEEVPEAPTPVQSADPALKNNQAA